MLQRSTKTGINPGTHDDYRMLLTTVENAVFKMV